MTRTTFAVLVVIAIPSLQACGGQTEGPDTTASTTTEHGARFVGNWDISFMTDRDSSATFTLAASGAIRVGRQGSGTPLEAIAEKPGGTLHCAVGDRWHSAGSSVLVLAGACSDGVARDVQISFPADATGNASSDLRVTIASVGGESGWRATDFNGPWMLQECPLTGCGP